MPNTDQFNSRQIELAQAWGQRIAEARRAAGETQKSAAVVFGVHLSTFRAWEQGRRIPGLYQRRQLCERYKLDRGELMCDEDHCPHCGSNWK